MHFSTVSALAVFSLIGTAFSAPTAFDNRLVKRATTASEAISALDTLTTDVKAKTDELTSALDGVDTSDAQAVYDVAAPILTDVDNELKSVASSLDIQKRMLVRRQDDSGNATDIDERTLSSLFSTPILSPDRFSRPAAVAPAIADAVTALLNLIEPLEDLIESNPVLGALLSPLLSSLSVDVAFIVSGLGLVLDGVLDLVSNLLSGLGSALGNLGLGDLLG
ncbi:hypothetical protein JCM10207_002099 [Rhodosporidiobolus poonsookiae]